MKLSHRRLFIQAVIVVEINSMLVFAPGELGSNIPVFLPLYVLDVKDRRIPNEEKLVYSY